MRISDGVRELMKGSNCEKEICRACKFRSICHGGCQRQNVCYLKDDHCAYQKVLNEVVPKLQELMKRFIESNPGLRSRFNKFFEFPDYTVDELQDIFKMQCGKYQYKLTEEAENAVREKIISLEAAKGEHDVNAILQADITTDLVPSAKEIRLIKLLGTFPGKVAEAGAALSPAVLANYAYDLAKEFNQYYHDTPILREENQGILKFRLELISVMARTLRCAMGILGIELPERM